MLGRGLRAESITYDDWAAALEITRKHGLPPADAIHAAVARRLRVNAIATLNEDFKTLKTPKTTP